MNIMVLRSSILVLSFFSLIIGLALIFTGVPTSNVEIVGYWMFGIGFFITIDHLLHLLWSWND